jgi:hypothetical protein
LAKEREKKNVVRQHIVVWNLSKRTRLYTVEKILERKGNGFHGKGAAACGSQIMGKIYSVA